MTATTSDVISPWHWRVPEDSPSGRADQLITAALNDAAFSRSRVQKLIEDGALTVNGQPQRSPAKKLHSGDQCVLTVPEAIAATPTAQHIPLDIVYEDADMLVINKQPGLVVHPGAGHHDQTLVNALLAHCGPSLSGINGVMRPGIVHRLDKDTSGLLVAAKHDAAHQHLSAQFSGHRLRRRYIALVWGRLYPTSGRIETAIGRDPKNRQRMAVLKTGGKNAITHYQTLAHYGDIATLVSLELETGRTHQIRVHMDHKGHSLIGDPVYAGKGKPKITKATSPQTVAIIQQLETFHRQALHAAELHLTHPMSQTAHHFTVGIAFDLQTLLDEISFLLDGKGKSRF